MTSITHGLFVLGLCFAFITGCSQDSTSANGWTIDSEGSIIRGDKQRKEIALVFTGDEFGEGGTIVARALRSNQVMASFFLTGRFYNNTAFHGLISELKNDGHYLGPHSNDHLLYADWKERSRTLVSADSFRTDLQKNYKAMEKFGIVLNDAQYFLPPFEWYNKAIVHWSKQAGVTLINFTPGTLSTSDYTYPEMQNRYRTSDAIYRSILTTETLDDGLNGYILLFHVGVDPRRNDKFYDRLDGLIRELKSKGYRFVRIDKLLQ